MRRITAVIGSFLGKGVIVLASSIMLYFHYGEYRGHSVVKILRVLCTLCGSS
jgi:hypothetical protein